MVNDPAAALAEAAEIMGAVRIHKRSASYHKREVSLLMERLAELRRECERLGIDLTITWAGRRPK